MVTKCCLVTDGKVEIESSRYPFCFSGDPKSTGATTGMIEFVPFNEELNRFTLVVENAPADKCKVTWGKSSKEFSKEQLAKGINLAAEFIDNPFSEPFRKVEAAVREQQKYETPLVKSVVTKLPDFKKLVPEEIGSDRKNCCGGHPARQAIDRGFGGDRGAGETHAGNRSCKVKFSFCDDCYCTGVLAHFGLAP